jgi:hypothetical protein
MQIARALISSSSACALEVLAARDRYRCDYATSRRSSPYTTWLATLQRVPSFECYDLANFEFIMLVRAGSGGRSPRGSLGYGDCVVTLVGQAGSRCLINPQLSTGFPASPGYPHLVDNRAPDRYS